MCDRTGDSVFLCVSFSTLVDSDYCRKLRSSEYGFPSLTISTLGFRYYLVCRGVLWHGRKGESSRRVGMAEAGYTGQSIHQGLWMEDPWRHFHWSSAPVQANRNQPILSTLRP